MNDFTVDERILAESELVCSNTFSNIYLVRDTDLPWFIIVPKIKDAVEIIDLDSEAQQKLLDQINKLSSFLKAEFKADKINIGAIGNVVRQLHIHIVGRFFNDRIFPKPPWGLKQDINKEQAVWTQRFKHCQNIQQLFN